MTVQTALGRHVAGYTLTASHVAVLCEIRQYLVAPSHTHLDQCAPVLRLEQLLCRHVQRLL
jgi:hypothetical protein